MVRHSLLFSNVCVESRAYVAESVILPDVVVEANAVVKNAVVDRGCRIPQGMVIGEDPEQDAEYFDVSPGGVVLVTPEMLGIHLHHVR